MLLKLAWRNIFRNTRRTVLTGAAMTVGFVFSSLNFAFIEGSFGDAINAYTQAGAGHIQIHKAGYLDKPTLFETFPPSRALDESLARVPGVKSWTPRLYAPALAFIGPRTTAVRITGVDPAREAKTTRLLSGLREGRTLDAPSAKEVLIGGALADILQAQVGSPLVLIAQGADGSVANDIFTVVGVLKAEGGLGSRACYVPLAAAQEFLALPGRVHELTVVLNDYRRSRPAASAIASALRDPGLEVKAWEDVEKQFYQMMTTKRKSNNVVLFIIYLIVCLGVVNTVTMSLLERTREFGVLKAIGTRPARLLLLIQLEVTCLSVLACALGAVLSWWLDSYFSVHGIHYPQPMNLGGVVMTQVSTAVNAGVILVPAILTLASAQVVSLMVAWRAAKLQPVKAMRQ